MRRLLTLFVCAASFSVCPAAQGQAGGLTLGDVIRLAQQKSIAGMGYRNIYRSNYWQYRSFQADRLPSLNFGVGLFEFDRSLRLLQDAQTGLMSYIENYNMNNQARLSINQRVAATGGTLSLYSSLSRFDQYEPVREITYYSQPVTLSYLQPLWSFNQMKWDQKLEPLKFEKAKKEYLESMESITINASSLFWEVAIQQINYDIARKNYENTKKMYQIASERFKLGSVKKNDLLQLELRMFNDSIAINDTELQLVKQKMQLCSYIGYNEDDDVRLNLDYALPDVAMEYGKVLELSLKNSSFQLSQHIEDMSADMAIAQARGNRRISAEVHTRFGLSNSSNDIGTVYKNPLDQEVFGFSLEMPIMDWGMGKGRVRMAQSRAEATKSGIMQAQIDYEQDIRIKVIQFNNQKQQCEIARRAKEIADERYEIVLEDFARGTVTVTDFNTAQSEKDAANRNYVSQLSNYWTYYFTLRKKMLYDFISGTDISAEFDKIVE